MEEKENRLFLADGEANIPSESGDDTLGKVAKVGFWLYIDLLATSIFSYGYWIILAAIAGPEILGITSAATSLSWIILGIVLLGVPIGLQKIVGSKGDDPESIAYLFSSFIFIFIVSLIGNVLTLLVLSLLEVNIGLDSSTIVLALVLAFVSSISSPPKNFLVGVLRTKSLCIVDIFANVFKIITGVILIVYGFGSDGALWGYIGSVLVSLLLYFKVIRDAIKNKDRTYTYSVGRSIELMKAGFANYLPNIVTTIGIQLGIIILLNGTDATTTGIYFIAFSLFNAVLALPTAVLGMLLPALSRIESNQEEIARKMTNTVIAIATPFAFALATYAEFVLGIFGSSFVSGSSILWVLCLSIPIACIVIGSTNFLYAVDEFKSVLLIGIAMSVVRLVLYLVLVPIYGGLGAAYAFDFGFLGAYLVMIALNSKTRTFAIRSAMIPCFIVSGMLSLLLQYLQIPWFIGGPLMLIISLIIFGRVKLLSKHDVLIITQSVISKGALERIASIGKLAIRVVFGNE
ncbi:MAG: hypothetical protein E4H14_07005 [Candidatus Thorarchaeota archaeon]|nr:MAG: hypothetical protein E4H14_07005 [Candidatus Thorarchaeota archaeon]